MSDLIPVSRKEQYLSKIDGMTNKSPDKTYTKEEYFFSEILGEALHKPVLETRYEMYLAKIAGREIGIPYPETRLERFLAKACGMDIETPTPITREEIFWSNYTAIVEFEIENTPPLTYKTIEGTLKNYRIYGNTVNGESVGDRTANLFDGNIISAYTEIGSQHRFKVSNDATSIILETTLLSSTVTINVVNANRCYVSYYNTYPSNDDVAELFVNVSLPLPQTITVNTSYKYIMIQVGYQVAVSNIMLNSGSEPRPYEPYGYRVPVTVTNETDTETTNIYIPEQIKKVGDEAEYIDYGEQKQHRVRKNLFDELYPNINNNRVTYKAIYVGDGIFTLSCDIPIVSGTTANLFLLSGNVSSGASSTKNGVGYGIPQSAESIDGYVTIGYRNFGDVDPRDYNTMLNAGTSALPYEPYITDTELDVTLPALPTLPGTNTLSVGTEVQPSNVYIKYEGAR